MASKPPIRLFQIAVSVIFSVFIFILGTVVFVAKNRNSGMTGVDAVEMQKHRYIVRQEAKNQ